MVLVPAAGLATPVGATAGAAPAAITGASPIEMSGNSSYCSTLRPALTSSTRIRSMTCTTVS